MRPIHTALLLVATGPVTGVSQTPPAPAPAPARPPVAAPAYRGFTPGISYRDFLERARPLADSDFVRCQTSPHTAQVMECGVVIRGPNDAARFYLSAHFIEGNADVVAFYDSAGFGDKRGVPLVDRTKTACSAGRTRSERAAGSGATAGAPCGSTGAGGARPVGCPSLSWTRT